MLIGMVSTMDNEPRVRREASTLIRRGNEVIALGVRVDGAEPSREVLSDGLIVRRVELIDIRAVRRLKRMTRRRRNATGSVGAPSSASPSDAVPAAEPSAAAEPSRLADIRTLVHLTSAFVGFLWHGLRHRADVYHAHDAPPALAFWLIARLRGAAFVYESHEYWMAKLPDQPMSHRATVGIERFACRRAALVIAVNRTISDKMTADYAIAPPCVVINVPIDVTGLPEPLAPQADEPLRLLYHGIFGPERGLEATIEAVSSTTRPVQLTLRGLGELREDLERLVSRLDVADRVTFAEPVPMVDLPVAAVGAHVGLLPFSAELGYDLALPNKLFEYMAAGLAVLSSDLIELRRIVDEERVGRLFDGSPSGLARELEWFLDHPDELLEMRTRAHSAAQQRYNWAAQENVLVEAYPIPTRRPTGGGR